MAVEGDPNVLRAAVREAGAAEAASHVAEVGRAAGIPGSDGVRDGAGVDRSRRRAALWAPSGRQLRLLAAQGRLWRRRSRWRPSPGIGRPNLRWRRRASHGRRTGCLVPPPLRGMFPGSLGSEWRRLWSRPSGQHRGRMASLTPLWTRSASQPQTFSGEPPRRSWRGKLPLRGSIRHSWC